MIDDFMADSTAKAFMKDSEKVYCIFTKPNHVEKIVNYLNAIGLRYFITSDKQEIINFAFPFDVGVSYCCPYKLPIGAKEYYNYHPAPLPEYKGLTIYADAIRNRVKIWGVTLHKMTNVMDEGKIISELTFPVSPPYSTNELGTIAHAKLFELFRLTIGIEI